MELPGDLHLQIKPLKIIKKFWVRLNRLTSEFLDIFMFNNINLTFDNTTISALSSDHNPVFCELQNWQDTILNLSSHTTSWPKFKIFFSNITRPVLTLQTRQLIEQEISISDILTESSVSIKIINNNLVNNNIAF